MGIAIVIIKQVSIPVGCVPPACLVPGGGEQGYDVTSCLVPCSFVSGGGLVPGVGGLAPSEYGPTPSCGQNDTRL